MLLGLALGLALKRAAIAGGAFCAAGFRLVPHLWILFEPGAHPWSWFGPSVAVVTILWDGIAVPLVFIGVSLGRLGTCGIPTDQKWCAPRWSLATIMLAVAIAAVVFAALRYVPYYSVPTVALVALTAIAWLCVQRTDPRR